VHAGDSGVKTSTLDSRSRLQRIHLPARPVGSTSRQAHSNTSLFHRPASSNGSARTLRRYEIQKQGEPLPCLERESTPVQRDLPQHEGLGVFRDCQHVP
jgi:hypothetical protein